MKKFMFLSVGFEKPTQELMQRWMAWFASLEGRMVDTGHFTSGREISKTGTAELPFNHDALTGFVVITAENMAEAEKLAQTNPFVTSIRIYEVRSPKG